MCRKFKELDRDPRNRYGRRLLIACCVAFQTGCGSSSEPRVPSHLSAVSPTSLSGVVAQEVSPPPSVLVTDNGGSPLSGVSVTFSAVDNVLAGSVAVTNSSGIATTKWVLATAALPQVLVASIDAPVSNVKFTATAVPGPPHSIHGTGVGGTSTADGQHAPAGTAVPIPPSVIIADAYGNPIAGVPVTFAVGLGGGSVTGANATTDAKGIATVGSWTLGSVGTNTLIATAPGALSLTFTAQAD
jgi:Big-like domain-containing protein